MFGLVINDENYSFFLEMWYEKKLKANDDATKLRSLHFYLLPLSPLIFFSIYSSLLFYVVFSISISSPSFTLPSHPLSFSLSHVSRGLKKPNSCSCADTGDRQNPIIRRTLVVWNPQREKKFSVSGLQRNLNKGNVSVENVETSAFV